MTRTRLRTILLLAGILPALLVGLYAAKVVTMTRDNAAGRDATIEGRYDDARASFADTRSLNWFEPWVAAFDEGTAHHSAEQYDDAIADYEAALPDVPEAQECTVRTNLALAHEALGDRAQESHDGETAKAEWQAGIDALAAGECPARSEPAKAVDERLKDKLREQQQEQQQPQDDPKQPPPQPDDGQPEEDPEQKQREGQLDKQNQRGQEQRKEDQDLIEGDPDYSRPDSW